MQVNIQQLLPHREPFILISDLISVEDEHTISQFKITEQHVLVDNGYLSEGGIIENMAQTAAAGLAYLDQGYKRNPDKEPNIGYIGQIKGFKLYDLPRVGSTIETKTTKIHQIMNAHIVQSEVYLEEQLIAEAEVRVFVQS